MAWKELSVMDQRKAFVLEALSGVASFAELCRRYGIAAKTGYKWKSRFLADGHMGLCDQSRRPLTNASALSEEVLCRIVKLKGQYPAWGARKLREVYGRLHGRGGLPSESSFKRVLERCGLVRERPVRAAATAGRLQTRLLPKAPNELWTVDFKGWWYLRGGARCEPLTVRDGYSRFILWLNAPVNARWQTVRGAFEHLFGLYGLPGAIRSDNGSPFAASSAPLGLSQLSAWWTALGIDLDRIDPGHPEQNGAHERMHRDVADELECRPTPDPLSQNAALETWRNVFNCERPHEALGMAVPSDLYRPSERKYEGTPERLTYPLEYLDRQVNARGCLSVLGRRIRISHALCGWNVGLKPMGGGSFVMYFGRLCLGRIDATAGTFQAWRPEEIKAAQPKETDLAASGEPSGASPGALPQTPGFNALDADDGGVNRG